MSNKKKRIDFKNKKIQAACVVTVVLLVLVCSLVVFLIINAGNQDNSSLLQLEEQTFEINSKTALSELLPDGYSLEKDIDLPTDKLGENEYEFKYFKDDNEYSYTIKYTIVDTKKPELDFPSEVEITVGDELDLKSKAKVSDNSKQEVSVSIEGEYDTSKAGEYSLKVVATDPSNNKTDKEFKLIVKESSASQDTVTKPSQTTNSTTSKPSSSSGSNNSGVWCSAGFHYENGYGCVVDRIPQEKIDAALAAAEAYQKERKGKFFTSDPGAEGLGPDGLGYVESRNAHFWWEWSGDSWYINTDCTNPMGLPNIQNSNATSFLGLAPSHEGNYAGEQYGSKMLLWYVTAFGAGQISGQTQKN